MNVLSFISTFEWERESSERKKWVRNEKKNNFFLFDLLPRKMKMLSLD